MKLQMKGTKYLPFAGLYLVQGFVGAFMGKALNDQIAQLAPTSVGATALITLLGQVASAAWILKILIAPALDKFGRRARPFFFSTAAMALAVGLAAISQTTTALAAAVAAATFGKALQDVVVDQLVLDRFSDQREFARCQSVTVAALVSGGILGGTVMVKLGAQVPWGILCAVVALGVIVVSVASAVRLRFGSAQNPQRPRTSSSEAGANWSRTLLFALLVALTLNLAQGLTGPAVSPWLKNEVGLGKADRAEIYFVNDLCRMAGALLALALARAAWSRHAKLIGVCLLLAGSYIGLAFGEPVWSSRLWLAALVGVTGVAEGLWLSTYLSYFRAEIKVGSRAPATQWQLLMVAIEASDLIAKSIGGPVFGAGVKFATLALMAGIAQLLAIPAVLRHRRASR